MKRRLNQRARTSCSVRTEQGSLVSFYEGVEVSPTGIVVDLGRPVGARDQRIYVNMEIVLPERMRPLRALARPVWFSGTRQAYKFVRMSDVDRLNLAEHVDLAEIRDLVMH
ncbi:MAG TPA: hypothetical protein VH062_23495 [Polyangiaceae bacterium]|jgi:hypothetical protein|nr:hypothetical protein [Polyangiaceae bacterium]